MFLLGPLLAFIRTLLLGFIKDISQVAATAVLTVVHGGHEDTSTALGLRAFPPKSLDLAIAIDLVVLENSQLGLLPLVLDLLGGSVHLLLPLLGATTETQDKMEGRLLLNVVVGKGAAVFKLLSGKDQTLLVGGNALLVWWRVSGGDI